MWNILEAPWLLLLVAVAVFVILFIISAFKPLPKIWLLSIPAAIVITAFVLVFFVRTDKQKIQSTIRSTLRAIRNSDVEAFEVNISEDYQDSRHLSKQQLVNLFRNVLTEPVVDRSVLTVNSLEIDPPNAEAEIFIRILLDKSSRYYQEYVNFLLIMAQINLQKEGDDWLINNTEIIEINRNRTNWNAAPR